MSEIDLRLQKIFINELYNYGFNVPMYPIILNALDGLASSKNMCESNAPVIKKLAPWSKLLKKKKIRLHNNNFINNSIKINSSLKV